MGASVYMPVEDYTDEQTGRTFKAFEPESCVTGSDYERMGEPPAFRPAEFPEQIVALRDEYGLDDAEATQEYPPDDLDSKTVEELRALAADQEIEGRSGMNKSDLLAALRQ